MSKRILFIIFAVLLCSFYFIFIYIAVDWYHSSHREIFVYIIILVVLSFLGTYFLIKNRVHKKKIFLCYCLYILVATLIDSLITLVYISSNNILSILYIFSQKQFYKELFVLLVVSVIFHIPIVLLFFVMKKIEKKQEKNLTRLTNSGKDKIEQKKYPSKSPHCFSEHNRD